MKNLKNIKRLNIEYIPHIVKKEFHIKQKDIDSYTFDFKNKCQSRKKLCKSNLYRFIKKYKVQNKFMVICKHFYFKRFGPKLNGVLTRQMKYLKKKYWPLTVKKRCCNKLIILPKEEWNTPLNKKWKSGRYFFNNQIVLSCMFY